MGKVGRAAEVAIRGQDIVTGASDVVEGLNRVANGDSGGWWQALGGTLQAGSAIGMPRIFKCFAAGTPVHLDGEVKQIESVRVGDRVSECVKDPQGTGLVKARSREHRSESDDSGEEGSGDDDPDPAISFVDPEVWRLVTLVVTGEDGETTTVRWLRPVGWVEASRAVVGSVVRLEVGELGIDGVAMVKSIEPCPVIAAGNGPLVTCTFETTGQEVWAVEVEGEARAIRCTGGHLFYSMDRQRFVAAAELVDAELVWTVFGSRRIEKVAATGERTTVYNFEVSGVHRYLVGQVGVLVHNAGACGITNRGGKFADLNRSKLSNEVGHHMPQNRFNQSIGRSRADGPAMGMTRADHELTRTFSGRGRQSMVTDTGRNARQRMATDIKNIRELFGHKYDQGIREMLEYARTLPELMRVSRPR